MLTLIERILKKIMRVFLPVYCIEIVFQGVLFFQKDSLPVLMIHGVWVMLAMTMLLIYSLYDLHQLVFTRKDFFFYTLKYRVATVMFVYTCMYIVANYLFYLLYSTHEWSEMLFKGLSIVAFYTFNLALLMCCKVYSSRKQSTRIYLVLLIVTVILLPLVYVLHYQREMDGFMIGASNYAHAKQVYNLIIPVTVIRHDESFNRLMIVPLLMNSVIAAASLVGFTYVKDRPVNW